MGKRKPAQNSIDTRSVIITMDQYKDLIRCQVENEYVRKKLEEYEADTQRLKETLKMFLATCN